MAVLGFSVFVGSGVLVVVGLVLLGVVLIGVCGVLIVGCCGCFAMWADGTDKLPHTNHHLDYGPSYHPRSRKS